MVRKLEKPLLFINSPYIINERKCINIYNNLQVNKKYLIILKNGSTLFGKIKRINQDSIVIVSDNITYCISLLNVNNILLLNQSVV